MVSLYSNTCMEVSALTVLCRSLHRILNINIISCFKDAITRMFETLKAKSYNSELVKLMNL